MAAESPHQQAATPPKGLLGALIVVAVLASVAPWVAKALGLPLPVPTSLEVVDHVVPGVVVVGASALALSGRLPLFGVLIATLAAALAGLWMTATHVPLLWQARLPVDQPSWPTALIHSVPGIATFALTIPPAVWAWRRQAAVEAAAAAGRGSSKGRKGK